MSGSIDDKLRVVRVRALVYEKLTRKEARNSDVSSVFILWAVNCCTPHGHSSQSNEHS